MRQIPLHILNAACPGARLLAIVTVACLLALTPLQVSGASGMQTAVQVAGGDVYAQDPVAAFLQRNELNELLAVHLEQRLRETPAAEREALILELADVYAALLMSVDDPDIRESLEERGRELVRIAPADSAHQLRLALLRGPYRQVEQIAEDHRLRLSSEDELALAEEILERIIPQLQALLTDLERELSTAERYLNRAGPDTARTMAPRVRRLERLTQQARFITAWAHYYRAWILDRSQDAVQAQDHFARLLDPELPVHSYQNVSVDLRSEEYFARCILGMALCHSLNQNPALAIAWLEQLDHERTWRPLREQAPVWKIAVLLEHNRYRDVDQVLQQLRQTADELPLAWLRLIAVHALEDREVSGAAEQMARFAVTEIASRGNLQQVLDLASRYGAEALGSSGFAVHYVRGVIAYQETRHIHDADVPAADPAVIERYQQAIDALQQAMQEPDAGQYSSAIASAQQLIGLSMYFQGRYLDASEALVEASQHLPAEEAAESLWMAIVALDSVVAVSDSASLRDELQQLIEQFLDRFPSHEHAPRLVLKLAQTEQEASPEIIDQLLTVPESSSDYYTARSQAADMLYRSYAAAELDDKGPLGNRYVDVALPLFERAIVDVAGREVDEAAVDRLILRARRLLDVSLNPLVERLVAARRVIDHRDQLQSINPDAFAAVAQEFRYRSMQERLVSGSGSEASAIARQITDVDPESRWARLAAQAMFRYANRLREEATVRGESPEAALQLMVEWGWRLVQHYQDEPDALQNRNVLAHFIAVADASWRLLQIEEDVDLLRQTYRLYERELLQVRPDNVTFLRRAALLGEKLGQTEQALGRWRMLVAGLSTQDPRWYEAKFHQISLLEQIDPQRARQVMEQHKVMFPQYGPDPWGAQLKGLDLQLSVPAEDNQPERNDETVEQNAAAALWFTRPEGSVA